MLLVAKNGSEVSRHEAALGVPPEALSLGQEALRSGARVAAPVQVTQDHQPSYLAVAYPVRNGEGESIGALATFMNLGRLQDVFMTLPLPPGSVVTIYDRDRRILARSLEPESYVGRVLDTLPPMSEQPTVPEARTGMDGVTRMYGEAPVPSGPWMVSVGIPTTLAFDRAASLWSRSFAILAIGLAGWLIVAFVVSRRLGSSVAHLDAEAQRIARGDFRPIDRKPMATREFAELQDAFDQMLGRFNETRGALDEQMAEERRMRQENQSLQRQVIRQERLAAVGQLVSGVAHEINNPLQAILGFAELLQMQPEVPQSVKGDLSLIQKESARACAIIRNLALFARQQTGEASPIRLGDVITSVIELRQRRLESENIDLRVEDTSGQQVLAVMAELQQVLLNFVVNAEQAIVMSGRLPGRITLRTRDAGDRVILEVEDTGPGISPENEAKLFQPFFTTKPVGQGTGLGLSVSYGIVDSLGGKIGYRNAAAGGAIFYFELPAAK
jgi:C4-dicarboxylate-specific signal transduction histidine kinase